MGIKISSLDKVVNLEPEKNKDWEWMSWDTFMTLENKFYPFEFLFAQGLDSLDKIKAIVES